MFNPIKDLFNPIDHPFDFWDMNWKKMNVDKPYAIIMTGRSGSTFLAQQINNLEKYGNPREFFSESQIKHLKQSTNINDFTQYLEHIVNTNSQNGYFGFEIDAQRFFWLNELINIKDLIQSKESIPTIWLTRQDLVSQAYSFATAKSTGVWHKYSSNSGDTSSTEASGKNKSINDELIWKELILLLKWEQKIEQLFANCNTPPLRITYEQLICDQVTTLARVLIQIGLNLDEVKQSLVALNKDNQTTNKLQYSEKNQILTSFNAKYANLLNQIYQNRSNIDLKSISNMVLQSAIKT